MKSNLPKPTKGFLVGLEKANKSFEVAKASGKNSFNIFEALGVEEKENYHSLFIAYLLNPQSEHYQSVFLDKFVDKLKKYKKIPKIIFNNALNLENFIEIHTERVAANLNSSRRMDILLSFKDNVHIIIENKIYAKDQSGQIKDYINEIHKKNKRKAKLDSKESAKQILVIYLHKDSDKIPSEASLGGSRKQWKIASSGEYNIIRDENGEMKAYFLALDYHWIKEWLGDCLESLRKVALSKARNAESNRGEMGINKIIFGIEQYIEILEWYITREYEEESALRDFIVSNDKNTQMALSIYKDIHHESHEIVSNIWNEVCENVVERFYDNLHRRLESGFKIGDEKWTGDRTDDNGVNKGLFWIYSTECKLRCLPIVTFSYMRSLYRQPSLTLCMGWWYDNEKEEIKHKEIVEECKPLFKDRVGYNLKKYHASYQNSHIFGEDFNAELSEEYAFAHWLMIQGDEAVDRFLEIVKHFISLPPIQETINEVEKYIAQKLS